MLTEDGGPAGGDPRGLACAAREGYQGAAPADGVPTQEARDPDMTEIVLHDIDQVLVDRIKRVADARGWTLPRTLLHLLEQGLHVYEGDGSVHFDNSENDVLEAALAALQDIPDDGGFAMIGKIPSGETGP